MTPDRPRATRHVAAPRRADLHRAVGERRVKIPASLILGSAVAGILLLAAWLVVETPRAAASQVPGQVYSLNAISIVLACLAAAVVAVVAIRAYRRFSVPPFVIAALAVVSAVVAAALADGFVLVV